jgi:carbonic anhydrase/acetyltransferase-like protein (isoleucine patch superfamily)
VQDRAVIHSSPKLSSGLPAEVDIGSYVTIGHGAVLQSCTVKDNVLIGMNSVIQEGSIIESNSMVAAGAVVEPETHIPSGQLWAGFPARYVRDLTDEEIAQFKKTAIMYSELSAKHKEEFLPYGTIYQQAEALKH